MASDPRPRLGEEGQCDPHRGRGNQQEQERDRKPNRVEYPGVVEQGSDRGRQRCAENGEQIDQGDAGRRDRDLGGRVCPIAPPLRVP